MTKVARGKTRIGELRYQAREDLRKAKEKVREAERELRALGIKRRRKTQ